MKNNLHQIDTRVIKTDNKNNRNKWFLFIGIIITMLIVLALSQIAIDIDGRKERTPKDIIQGTVKENDIRTPTPITKNTQTTSLSPINSSIVIHIIVVHRDQPGHINTLLGSFNPAIGINVRMREAFADNSNQIEYSGTTNINGLVLLLLSHPIIDEYGNTQKVNISIDGYSGIITCRINPYYPGYYSKEIFLEGNEIRTYYPR